MDSTEINESTEIKSSEDPEFTSGAILHNLFAISVCFYLASGLFQHNLDTEGGAFLLLGVCFLGNLERISLMEKES